MKERVSGVARGKRGEQFQNFKTIQRVQWNSRNNLSPVSSPQLFPDLIVFAGAQLKGKSSRSGDSYQHHFDRLWHQGDIRFQHVIMKGWGEHLPMLEPFGPIQDQQPLPWRQRHNQLFQTLITALTALPLLLAKQRPKGCRVWKEEELVVEPFLQPLWGRSQQCSLDGGEAWPCVLHCNQLCTPNLPWNQTHDGRGTGVALSDGFFYPKWNTWVSFAAHAGSC